MFFISRLSCPRAEVALGWKRTRYLRRTGVNVPNQQSMTALPKSTNDDSHGFADPRHVTRDRRNLWVTFTLVLATSSACSIYASIDARGLYHDGMYYLCRIAESKWFFVPVAAR